MTVSEFCKEIGVSRATLYRLIQRHNVDMASLRDGDGHITSEGLSILSGITHPTHLPPAHRAQKTPVRGSSADAERLKHEIEILTLKLEAANEAVTRLTAECADLKTANERLTAANERLTAETDATRNALMQELSRSWFDRLTGRHRANIALLNGDK